MIWKCNNFFFFPFFKQLFHEGIFQIIDFCDDSDLTYLNACFNESTRNSLKALHADYIKFYKFTGKI